MRLNVLFYDSEDDKTECDSCDDIKCCAHISLGITNFVWCICEDCLNEVVKGYE